MSSYHPKEWTLTCYMMPHGEKLVAAKIQLQCVYLSKWWWLSFSCSASILVITLIQISFIYCKCLLRMNFFLLLTQCSCRTVLLCSNVLNRTHLKLMCCSMACNCGFISRTSFFKFISIRIQKWINLFD